MIDVQLGSKQYELGEIVWEYLRVRRRWPASAPASPEDTLIMVLGSPDLAVADHAADLLKRDVAARAVVSGGCAFPGVSSPALEADVIGKRIVEHCVERDRLILERSSQNTSDHFWLTQKLLAGRPEFSNRDIPPKFVILVPTPVAERRALATGRKRWPDSDFCVDGVPETYQDYMERTDRGGALSRMVGEIERIRAYPLLQYMTQPDEPMSAEVVEAYECLRMDFNARPVPDPYRTAYYPPRMSRDPSDHLASAT